MKLELTTHELKQTRLARHAHYLCICVHPCVKNQSTTSLVRQSIFLICDNVSLPVTITLLPNTTTPVKLEYFYCLTILFLHLKVLSSLPVLILIKSTFSVCWRTQFIIVLLRVIIINFALLSNTYSLYILFKI